MEEPAIVNSLKTYFQTSTPRSKELFRLWVRAVFTKSDPSFGSIENLKQLLDEMKSEFKELACLDVGKKEIYQHIIQPAVFQELNNAINSKNPPFRDAKLFPFVQALAADDQATDEFKEKIILFAKKLLESAKLQLAAENGDPDEIIKQYYGKITEFLNRITIDNLPIVFVLLCYDISKKFTQINNLGKYNLIANIIGLRYVSPLITNFSANGNYTDKEKKFINGIATFMLPLTLVFDNLTPDDCSQELKITTLANRGIVGSSSLHETTCNEVVDFYLNTLRRIINLPQDEYKRKLSKLEQAKKSATVLTEFEYYQLNALFKALNSNHQTTPGLDEYAIANLVDYFTRYPIEVKQGGGYGSLGRKNTLSLTGDKVIPDDATKQSKDKKQTWSESAYLLYSLFLLQHDPQEARFNRFDFLNLITQIHHKATDCVAPLLCYYADVRLVDSTIRKLIQTVNLQQSENLAEDSLLFQMVTYRVHHDPQIDQTTIYKKNMSGTKTIDLDVLQYALTHSAEIDISGDKACASKLISMLSENPQSPIDLILTNIPPEVFTPSDNSIAAACVKQSKRRSFSFSRKSKSDDDQGRRLSLKTLYKNPSAPSPATNSFTTYAAVVNALPQTASENFSTQQGNSLSNQITLLQNLTQKKEEPPPQQRVRLSDVKAKKEGQEQQQPTTSTPVQLNGPG